jgi:hypothetical protein
VYENHRLLSVLHIGVSAPEKPPSDRHLALTPHSAEEQAMEDLLQFMQDCAADPDMVKAVMLAFAMACRELNATDTSAIIKSMIARRIIGHAQRGERDADRLCRRTVADVLPKRAC